MKTFHFIERVGRKIIRIGSVPAPSMDGFPKADPASVIEIIDAPCGVPLPAYWDQLRRSAVSLPPRPSPAYEFNYDQLKWVADVQLLWREVRAERDRRMSASDWVVLPDVSMSAERKQAWLEYRQALRDITKQSDPAAIVWPKAPG